MNRFHKLLIAITLPATLTAAAMAQQVSKEQIKGLDEQVQDIKKDVLSISSDLMQLEEKLLYPSNTQASFFLSLNPNAKIRLDSVKIKIDGKDATHHIYTFKELEALKKGGVQRIHTGNVRSGEHSIEVTVYGKTSGNADYQQTASHKFTKGVEPKLLEIALDGSSSAGQAIQFKE